MALSDAAPLLATTSSLVAPSGGVGAPADDDEAGDCFVAGAASRATREEQLLSLLFDARGAVDGDGAGMGVHEGADTQRGAYGAAEPTAQQQALTYPVAPSAPSAAADARLAALEAQHNREASLLAEEVMRLRADLAKADSAREEAERRGRDASGAQIALQLLQALPQGLPFRPAEASQALPALPAPPVAEAAPAEDNRQPAGSCEPGASAADPSRPPATPQEPEADAEGALLAEPAPTSAPVRPQAAAVTSEGETAVRSGDVPPPPERALLIDAREELHRTQAALEDAERKLSSEQRRADAAEGARAAWEAESKRATALVHSTEEERDAAKEASAEAHEEAKEAQALVRRYEDRISAGERHAAGLQAALEEAQQATELAQRAQQRADMARAEAMERVARAQTDMQKAGETSRRQDDRLAALESRFAAVQAELSLARADAKRAAEARIAAEAERAEAAEQCALLERDLRQLSQAATKSWSPSNKTRAEATAAPALRADAAGGEAYNFFSGEPEPQHGGSWQRQNSRPGYAARARAPSPQPEPPLRPKTALAPALQPRPARDNARGAEPTYNFFTGAPLETRATSSRFREDKTTSRAGRASLPTAEVRAGRQQDDTTRKGVEQQDERIRPTQQQQTVATTQVALEVPPQNAPPAPPPFSPPLDGPSGFWNGPPEQAEALEAELMAAQMRRDELRAEFAKLPIHTAGRTLAIRRKRAAVEKELASLEQAIARMKMKLKSSFFL